MTTTQMHVYERLKRDVIEAFGTHVERPRLVWMMVEGFG
jgi:hypothetical protein